MAELLPSDPFPSAPSPSGDRFAAPGAATTGAAANGADLVREAAALTRDLHRARPLLYWGDLLLSVAVGYGALLLAAVPAGPVGLRVSAGAVAVLALYRAVSFIHELTHLKPAAVPGLRFGWNLLVGAPLMAPSFMYEGVHNLHHARSRYGTAQDPEYLPPGLLAPRALAGFTAAAALAPMALLLRFAVLAPVSALSPRLRAWVVARASALAVNPDFRRPPPAGAELARWRRWETATTLWAVGLVAATAAGRIPLESFLVFLGVASGVAVVNQVRTLAAHLWEGDGAAMSVTDQYLDSVNVPPPSLLPGLWAPVGLRYHALHHLLPGLPYHALGTAHRRLAAALPAASPYHRAHHRGLLPLVRRLAVGRSAHG